MSTLHAVAQQVWDLLPAITTCLKFGTALLSFGMSTVSAARLRWPVTSPEPAVPPGDTDPEVMLQSRPGCPVDPRTRR